MSHISYIISQISRHLLVCVCVCVPSLSNLHYKLGTTCLGLSSLVPLPKKQVSNKGLFYIKLKKNRIAMFMTWMWTM